MSLIKNEAPTQKSGCHRRKAANTDRNWLLFNYEEHNLHISYWEGFLSLVLICWAPFNFVFLALLQSHRVWPRDPKQSPNFPASLEPRGCFWELLLSWQGWGEPHPTLASQDLIKQDTFISKRKTLMLQNWGKSKKLGQSFLINTWLTPACSTTYVAYFRKEKKEETLKPPDRGAVPLHGQGLISSASHRFTNIFPIYRSVCEWGWGEQGTGREVDWSLGLRNLPSLLSGDRLGPAPRPSQ